MSVQLLCFLEAEKKKKGKSNSLRMDSRIKNIRCIYSLIFKYNSCDFQSCKFKVVIMCMEILDSFLFIFKQMNASIIYLKVTLGKFDKPNRYETFPICLLLGISKV